METDNKKKKWRKGLLIVTENINNLGNTSFGGEIMLYLFLALVFSLFVAIFAVQNSLTVVVSFLSWSFQTSLVIIILGSAILGALVILSLATLMQIKSRWTLQKAKQRQGELEAEIKTLKERLEKESAKDVSKNDL